MLVLASASPRRRELLTQVGYTFTVHPAHIPEDPLPAEDPVAYVTRLARQKAEAVFAQLSPSAAHGGPTAPAPTPPPDLHSTSTPHPYQGTTSVVAHSPHDNPGALAPGESVSSPPPQHLGDTAPPHLVVLGADTTVVIDDPTPAAPGTACASTLQASASPQTILAKPESPADAARMLRLLSGRTHRVITGVALVSSTRTEVAAEITAVRFLTLSEEEIAAYIATGEPMDKAGAYAIQGRAARWIPRIQGCYFNVVGLPLALVTSLLDAAGLHPTLTHPRR